MFPPNLNCLLCLAFCPLNSVFRLSQLTNAMTFSPATLTPPSNQPVGHIPLPVVDCRVAPHPLWNNALDTTTIPLVTQGTQNSEYFVDVTELDDDNDRQQILATQSRTTFREHPGTLRFPVRHRKWSVFELLFQHFFLISFITFFIYFCLFQGAKELTIARWTTA